MWTMSTRQPPARKPRGRYHHGSLRRALVDEAVRTIQRSGAEALTLRGVGAALGVSRTALYRHFADKDALLAFVARDGFVALKAALDRARAAASSPRDQLTGMGAAYVRFAIDNQAHYEVMFGRFLERCQDEPDLRADAGAAFQALLDMIADLQREKLIRQGDALQLSRFVWAAVHGIAMLAINGQLGPDRAAGLALYKQSAPLIRASLE
jgi:AcrR family transcriptional regulator